MRASIRGLGLVFPGGEGREAFSRALESGQPLWKPSRFREGLLAAEMNENLKPLVQRKGLAALSRGALLAAAAIENLAAAEPWLLAEGAKTRCALVVGTAFGHIESKAEFHREARREGVRLVSPILFPNTIINSLAGHAAILFGLSGPNSTVTSGRRSGVEALLRAATLLEAGRAQRAIAVGCDEVSSTLLRGIESRASEGLDPAIPPGEAAAALILEREDSGTGPGAMGRLLGAAERNTVSKGLRRAAEEAFRAALEDAGLKPGDVARLSLGGRFGGGQGQAEHEAATLVFGEAVPRTSIQAVFGETSGAHGALAAAAALLEGRSRVTGPVLVSCVDTTGATCALVCA